MDFPERTAVAQAAANIAFIKYWGARDLANVVPSNPSISMTLAECRSCCRAHFTPGNQGEPDRVLLERDGELVDPGASFTKRVVAHLERLRRWAGAEGTFRIETRNAFPASAGLASSASGFSALTTAVLGCFGREVSPSEHSDLARSSGSGSAARSVFGGYVEWPSPEEAGATHAVQLHSASHWRLCDVIALVETGAKSVSSLEGHRRAASSPYFEARQRALPARLSAVRSAIAERDFGALVGVVEEEAIDLHLITMSSKPPIFYWKPATLAVLEAVRDLRASGVPAASTMDAGANVHVLCEPESEAVVAQRLSSVPGVVSVIRDRTGPGPSLEIET